MTRACFSDFLLFPTEMLINLETRFQLLQVANEKQEHNLDFPVKAGNKKVSVTEMN